MNIVDVNVLLYAVNVDAPDHDDAKRWLEQSLSGRETVGFAWLVLVGFLRLVTKPSIFARTLSVSDAVTLLEEWLAQPGAVIVEPTASHARVFTQLIGGVGTGGNLVNDAHLAALAIEHRGEVVSYDRDFGRFPGVSWRLPG